MSSWLFQIAMGWQCLLSCVLSIYALRAKSKVTRILALDTLSLTVVGVLSVLAAVEQEVAFLDLALVVAMMGFIQTLAAVRYTEARADTETRVEQ